MASQNPFLLLFSLSLSLSLHTMSPMRLLMCFNNFAFFSTSKSSLQECAATAEFSIWYSLVLLRCSFILASIFLECDLCLFCHNFYDWVDGCLLFLGMIFMFEIGFNQIFYAKFVIDPGMQYFENFFFLFQWFKRAYVFYCPLLLKFLYFLINQFFIDPLILAAWTIELCSF